jgi:hypothetical protein
MSQVAIAASCDSDGMDGKTARLGCAAGLMVSARRGLRDAGPAVLVAGSVRARFDSRLPAGRPGADSDAMCLGRSAAGAAGQSGVQCAPDSAGLARRQGEASDTAGTPACASLTRSERGPGLLCVAVATKCRIVGAQAAHQR